MYKYQTDNCQLIIHKTKEDLVIRLGNNTAISVPIDQIFDIINYLAPDKITLEEYNCKIVNRLIDNQRGRLFMPDFAVPCKKRDKISTAQKRALYYILRHKYKWSYCDIGLACRCNHAGVLYGLRKYTPTPQLLMIVHEITIELKPMKRSQNL